MIQVFSLLLIYQLLGELIVRAFTLPIPGPVIGMALLFL
ncbi:MAG: CidA/LrgA family protein, partial [Propionivibrio sp.]|nr:CidA/LrgA family protein [Propionivibrio sp.]